MTIQRTTVKEHERKLRSGRTRVKRHKRSFYHQPNYQGIRNHILVDDTGSIVHDNDIEYHRNSYYVVNNDNENLILTGELARDLDDLASENFDDPFSFRFDYDKLLQAREEIPNSQFTQNGVLIMRGDKKTVYTPVAFDSMREVESYAERKMSHSPMNFDSYIVVTDKNKVIDTDNMTKKDLDRINISTFN